MSRVLRGAAAEPARWRTTGLGGVAGLQEFRPRRIDSGGAAVAEAPEVEEPKAAEPLPPPPEPAVDLDAIRKQAFQEGFAAGEEAGARRAERAAAERLAELGGIVDEVARYKPALREAAARETVELAFAVARRIVRRELTVDPGLTLAMVKACLGEYPGLEVRRIRVHPSSAAAVEEHFGETIEVAGDAAVAPGGAVLETTQGRLDARIDTQLAEIERGLTDR